MLPSFLLPYNEVDTTNPIYQKDLRHLRWLSTERSLKRYNRLLLIGLPLLAVFWWLLERLNINFGYVQSDYKYTLLNLLLVIAAGVMFLSSLYSVPAVIGTFNAQYTSAYWDMLRLTPQYNGTILYSQDAIAQLRLWPLTAVEIGFRLTIVLLYTLNNFYDIFQSTAARGESVSISVFGIYCWIGWAAIMLLGVTIIFEPVIRTRLIVAMHVLITVTIKNLLLALLAGLMVVVAFHLVQMLIIANLWSLFQKSVDSSDYGGIVVILCLIPLCIAGGFILWFIAGVIRRTTFSFAHNHAFRQD